MSVTKISTGFASILTAAMILAASTGGSLADPHGGPHGPYDPYGAHHPPTRPTCTGSCQTDKVTGPSMNPVVTNTQNTTTPIKSSSGGSSSGSGKNYRQN